MGTGQISFVYIDLPKSAYWFTKKMSFWQVFFAIVSIFFMSVDTAINDIIDHAIASISHNLKQITENLVMSVGGLFCPQVAYA